MEGEPKREMYDLLPPHLYPTTVNIRPEVPFDEVLNQVQIHNLKYPFVVKPEIGGQGILFRKIDNEAQLRNYHQHVPIEYIMQAMITYPMEVSVFYIRHPKAARGKVTGFLHKIPLHIVGDGTSTVKELILVHPKAAKRRDEHLSKHADSLDRVLAEGEKYILSYAANHNRGALFVDLKGYTLFGAYAEILAHWKDLYQISRYNRKQGIAPWSFMKGYKFLKKTKELYKVMREVDGRMG